MACFFDSGGQKDEDQRYPLVFIQLLEFVAAALHRRQQVVGLREHLLRVLSRFRRVLGVR